MMNRLSGSEWLSSLGIDQPKPGLARMARLKDALFPGRAPFAIIQVGGTNGKGSTTAMVDQCLRECGYRVGRYTSPHLQSPCERIQIDGRQITHAEFAVLAQTVHDLVVREMHEDRPSFFEVLTAMMFMAFWTADLDLVVLEVGLGGRWDATTVIPADVNAITTIGYDHQELLGETLRQIASEKVAMVPRHGRLVTTCEEPEIVNLFRAEGVRVPFQLWHRAQSVRWTKDRQLYQGPYLTFSVDDVALQGAYQFDNACCSAMALERLIEDGWRVDLSCVVRGFRNTVWSGRFERLDQGGPILLDGSHNRSAAESLASEIERGSLAAGAALIIGIKQGKDYRAILNAFGRLPFALVIVVPLQTVDSISVATLVDVAQQYWPVVVRALDMGQALQRAREQITSSGLIVVTGSLYAVADARRCLGLVPGAETP